MHETLQLLLCESIRLLQDPSPYVYLPLTAINELSKDQSHTVNSQFLTPFVSWRTYLHQATKTDDQSVQKEDDALVE